MLNNIFEPTFIPTSYSCRIGKGTHKAVKKLADILRRESRNNAHQCWALKCDIRKFFDSIDHEILLGLLKRKIKDEKTLWLVEEIIGSYASRVVSSNRERERVNVLRAFGKGCPIGNLTSQLFANIYLNEFDQFVKHELKVKNYLRYTDDFVIISTDRQYLEGLLPKMQAFLREKLRLEMHPQKIEFRTFHQGADFLGYVIRPHHVTVRTKTRRRIFRKLKERVAEYKDGILTEAQLFASLQSYLGILSHTDAYKLKEELIRDFWCWML